MIATLVSAVGGAVVAVVLSVGGVAALTPSVDPAVPQGELVKYGDNGRL